MERKGIIAAGNMLVDHVHQIGQWPERGWLVEIVHSERATGGAPCAGAGLAVGMGGAPDRRHARRAAAAGGRPDWRG